jgi:hypothetical protein
MLARLKRRARDKMRGRAGQRFQDHYWRAKREKQTPAAGKRIVNLVLAVVALIIAVLLVVFPGPAIPFFLIAGVLLASESLLVARLMDWLELRFRATWKWGKKRWDRLPHGARVTLKVLAPCLSLTCAFLTWRFLRG